MSVAAATVVANSASVIKLAKLGMLACRCTSDGEPNMYVLYYVLCVGHEMFVNYTIGGGFYPLTDDTRTVSGLSFLAEAEGQTNIANGRGRRSSIWELKLPRRGVPPG